MTKQNQIFSRGYYALDDIIGVRWDSSVSSPSLVRVDESLEALPTDYNWSKYYNNHPIWGQMQRCAVTSAGVATFGVDAKGTGLDLTSDYIMTRIPRVYTKFVHSAPYWYWLVSPEPSAGFSLHPAFYQRGHSSSPATYIYVGSYNASANGGTYSDVGTTNTYTASDWTGLKLTSKSGVKPLTSGTMTQFEAAGNAIGTGWGVVNFHTWNLLQELFYIENSSLNSQSVLGNGRTNTSNVCASISGTYLDFPTVGGGSAVDIQSLLASNGSYGDTSGSYRPVVYRGVENIFGNIWQLVPGYNTIDTAHHILKRDGTGTIAAILDSGSYEEITSPVPLSALNPSGTVSGNYCYGYISGIALDGGNILGSMFVPGALVGSSSTYLADNCYSHQSGISQTGVLLVGGHWSYGAQAGVGCRHSYNGSSSAGVTIGARLEMVQ